MAPDPARVFHIASTICDAIFLLILPIRLWKLRRSGIKNSPEWLGPFKAVGIPRLSRVPIACLTSNKNI